MVKLIVDKAGHQSNHVTTERTPAFHDFTFQRPPTFHGRNRGKHSRSEREKRNAGEVENEEESRSILTNLRWAREEQLKQVKVTAHPPYGYDRNSETYTWCVNPQKARRVKKLRVRRPVQQKLRLHFAGRWKRLDIMPGSTAPPILDSATAWMIRSSRHSPIGLHSMHPNAPMADPMESGSIRLPDR